MKKALLHRVLNGGCLLSLILFSGGSIATENTPPPAEPLFDTFCQNLKAGQVYDGEMEYICHFPGKTLAQVYSDYRTDFYQSASLKPALPKKNLSYQTDDTDVRYEWLDKHKLRLTVTHRVAIEESRYIFTENASGTSVVLIEETGY